MKKINNRKGGLWQILTAGLIFGFHAFLVSGQTVKQMLIFDGRGEARFLSPTNAEKQMVEREVRKKETVIRKEGSLDCDEDTFSVGAAANGSFTKPNAAQRAVSYELCRSGRSFGIAGIVIFENGKIVAHYTYGEGVNSDIAALPDINQNGLSEIMLIGGGIGQGYVNHAVEIIELAPGGVKSFGIADVYEDDYGTGKAKTSATAHKVTVQSGKTPVYFRETYTQKSEEGKWSFTRKSQKFSLRKDYVPKYNKIL